MLDCLHRHGIDTTAEQQLDGPVPDRLLPLVAQQLARSGRYGGDHSGLGSVATPPFDVCLEAARIAAVGDTGVPVIFKSSPPTMQAPSAPASRATCWSYGLEALEMNMAVCPFAS